MTESMRVLLITVFILAVFVGLSRCSTTGNKHGSSLGVPMLQDNPLMYTAGSLAEQDSVTTVDGNLNLRIHPLGTYMLFDQSVLLCGMPTDKFKGVTQPFVLVYERQAHRAVRGIGCHELVEAYSLVTKEKISE